MPLEPPNSDAGTPPPNYGLPPPRSGGRAADWAPAAGDATGAQRDPLAPAHYAALRAAAVLWAPVRAGVRTARLSAATMLVVGIAAVLFGAAWFFGELSDAARAGGLSGLRLGDCAVGVVLPVLLLVLAIIEWRGGTQLKRAVDGAARLLACNQLALLGLITAYCVYQMATFSKDAAGTLDPALRAQMASVPELADVEQQVQALLPLAVYGFYALVILLSVFFQGGLALYYHARRRHVRAFAQNTPAWVRRVFAELRV